MHFREDLNGSIVIIAETEEMLIEIKRFKHAHMEVFLGKGINRIRYTGGTRLISKGKGNRFDIPCSRGETANSGHLPSVTWGLSKFGYNAPAILRESINRPINDDTYEVYLQLINGVKLVEAMISDQEAYDIDARLEIVTNWDQTKNFAVDDRSRMVGEF